MLARWRTLDAQVVHMDATMGDPAATPLSAGAERDISASLLANLDALTALNRADAARAHARADATAGTAVAVTAVAGALAVLLALTLGRIIGRGIARPVVAVAAAAEQLAGGTMADLTRAMEALARGELDAARARLEAGPPLPVVRSRDEVAKLAASLGALEREAARIVAALDGAREGLAIRAAALRASEERYRRIVETAHEGIWVLDADNRTTFANRRMAEMLGHSVEEMQGAPLWAFLEPDVVEQAMGQIASQHGGEPLQVEMRFRHREGQTIWALIAGTPQCEPDGRSGGVLAMVSDITERKRDEQTRALLAAIVESSADAIIGKDLEGTITSWNDGAERLYGYAAAEVVGRSIALLVPPDRPDELPGILARLRQGERVTALETVRRRRDGHLLAVSLSISPIHDATGAVVGASTIAQDISERKRAEYATEQAMLMAAELAQLRQEQAQEAEALARVGAALAGSLEVEQIYTLVLDHVSHVLPYDHAAVLLYEDGWAAVAGSRGIGASPIGERVLRVADLVQAAAPWVRGVPALLADTDDVPSWIAVPPFSGEQRIRSAIVVPLVVEREVVGTFNVDSFTPNFYSEHHLQVAAAVGERVGQALHNARLYAAEQTARVEAEAAAQRLRALQTVTAALTSAYTSDEVGSLIVSQGSAAIGAESAVLFSRQVGQLEILAAHGSVVDALESDTSLARRLARVVHSSDQAVFRTAQAGGLDEVGDAFFEAIGWQPQALAMLPLLEGNQSVGVLLFLFDHRREFPPVEREFLMALAQQSAQAVERAHLHAEREVARASVERSEATLRAIIAASPLPILTVDLDSRVQSWNGAAERVFGWTAAEVLGGPIPIVSEADLPIYVDIRRRTIQAGSIDNVEVRRQRKDGVLLDMLLATAPLRDATGRVTGVLGMYVDISAQQDAIRELERAKDAVEELAQLRSDFVAAVSHELRTPLTAILGYGEMLQAHWARMSDERRLGRLGLIVQAANRQKRLVEDLLLATQMADGPVILEGVQVAVDTLVREATAQVQARYPGLRIAQDGPSDQPAWADAERTTQIVANLLDNAAKHTAEGSQIAVRWGEEGDRVVVRVVDHGPGIPDEKRGYLFTRFGRVPGSQMRAGYVGTGLGLFLGREWARGMGGDLELETTGPQGSTFRLLLPRSAP